MARAKQVSCSMFKLFLMFMKVVMFMVMPMIVEVGVLLKMIFFRLVNCQVVMQVLML